MSKLGTAKRILMEVGGEAGLMASVVLILAAFLGVAKTIPDEEWDIVYPQFRTVMGFASIFYIWFIVSRFTEVNTVSRCKKHDVAVIE